MGDKTFQNVPKNIERDVVDKFAIELGAHIWRHKLKRFHITLHGGEPSILPSKEYEYLLKTLREYCGAHITISVQTNGYAWKKDFLQITDKYGATLGISIDGPEEHNDAYRLNHAGRGSYRAIMRNVDTILASEYAHLLRGFLCVVNPDISTDEFFEWVKRLPLTRINLLWPIEPNYDAKPQFVGQVGRWMADLFTKWYEYDDPKIYIPLFFQVIANSFGSSKHSDQIVNDTMDMCVVNTDGRVEFPDYFRDKGEHAVDSGYNIKTHTLDEIATDPRFEALFNLKDYCPKACDECSVKSICGGGFLANRISKGTTIIEDLGNKSVMCVDHKILYETILNRTRYNAIAV
jgi:uncharacterized protein